MTARLTFGWKSMVTLAKDASRQTESGSLSSDETGSPEVYVRSFPEAGRPLRVSTAGGSTPAWRGDGRELFYLDLTGTLLAIEVEGTVSLELSSPTKGRGKNNYQVFVVIHLLQG